jgi:hypothetical protein
MSRYDHYANAEYVPRTHSPNMSECELVNGQSRRDKLERKEDSIDNDQKSTRPMCVLAFVAFGGSCVRASHCLIDAAGGGKTCQTL